MVMKELDFTLTPNLLGDDLMVILAAIDIADIVSQRQDNANTI